MTRPDGTSAALSLEDRERLGLQSSTPADPVGVWRTNRSRLLVWAWRHRVSLAVAIPLLVLTAALRLWGLSHGPALADDEGTYLAQAWAVQSKHSLAPYTYWYDHPPFGWMQLSLWTWVTHAFGGSTLAIVSGRRMMVAYSILDAGLMYVLARRLDVRRTTAALAVGALALSPLAVGYSRMVYLDNLALPWLLAAFVLAASPRRDLWAQVASGLCFAAAVLSKETSVLVLPGLLFLLWQRSVRQTRVFCLTGFAAGSVLLLLAYPLLAVLKGELLPGAGHVSLVEALQFQFFTRPSTGTLLSAHTGSRQVLDGWLQLDGWLLLAGLLALPVCLAVRRVRPLGVALLCLVVALVRPGYLPEPVVITVLPFAALALGAAADAAWSKVTTRVAAAGALATAAALLLALVVPSWVQGDRALAARDQSAPTAAAERWLISHHQSGRLLVDDTVWADLVTHGYREKDVVWLYKLDFVNNLDPSVRKRVRSYRDFSVVLDTPILRSALAQNPRSFQVVRQALAHSTVLATLGAGAERIEVRAVSTSPSTSPSTGTAPAATRHP